MSRQHSWHAHLRRFALTSLLLLGVATSAFAQFDRGTITGTVKDAQGGIVPGVTVTLTSTQTQQVRSTVTDGSGFYTFPNLTAGRYEISAELSGWSFFPRPPTTRTRPSLSRVTVWPMRSFRIAATVDHVPAAL